MERLKHKSRWLIACLVLLAVPVFAQVEVGDNIKLNLSGEISTGYTSSSGDTQGSSHGLDLSGSGTLHGYYYNPRFISFDVQPYYNRSQANSTSRSITDSNGFIATTNIFSGSRFPGSMSFSRTSNSTGQFGLPGATGLTTDGSGDTFVINWAALLPDLPTFNVSYLIAKEDTSLFGTDSRTNSSSRNFNLHSDYHVKGFLLNGFFIDQSNDRSVPSFLVNGFTQGATSGDSHSTSYGVIATHAIPLHGYWTASANRSTFGSETNNVGITGLGDGASNSFSTNASIQPLRRLGLSVGMGYQDNVFGSLQEQIAELGGVNQLTNSDISSHSLNFRGSADYQLTAHIRMNAQVNHSEQYLGGSNISFTQFGGGISTTFSKRFLGSFTFSVGAMDTATQEGNSGANMYGNVGFSRRFGRWEAGADASYSQQVQTIANIYTTSMYGYGGILKRKLGERFYWTNSARETHSGITQHSGTTNHSESFLTQIIYRRYAVNAVYSQSGGAAVLTSQGLVPVPGSIPVPLINAPVLYGATSYGGGVSATVSRFTFTGSYSKAFSQTVAATSSNNSTTMWNGLLRCRMRKLYFNAGFTRFQQSVSATGQPPSMLNSYFFGVSRWFNIF